MLFASINIIILLLLVLLTLIKCDDKVYKVRRDKVNSNITNTIDNGKVNWCLKILKENHVFPVITWGLLTEKTDDNVKIRNVWENSKCNVIALDDVLNYQIKDINTSMMLSID